MLLKKQTKTPTQSLSKKGNRYKKADLPYPRVYLNFNATHNQNRSKLSAPKYFRCSLSSFSQFSCTMTALKNTQPRQSNVNAPVL